MNTISLRWIESIRTCNEQWPTERLRSEFFGDRDEAPLLEFVEQFPEASAMAWAVLRPPYFAKSDCEAMLVELYDSLSTEAPAKLLEAWSPRWTYDQRLAFVVYNLADHAELGHERIRHYVLNACKLNHGY